MADSSKKLGPPPPKAAKTVAMGWKGVTHSVSEKCWRKQIQREDAIAGTWRKFNNNNKKSSSVLSEASRFFSSSGEEALPESERERKEDVHEEDCRQAERQLRDHFLHVKKTNNKKKNKEQQQQQQQHRSEHEDDKDEGDNSEFTSAMLNSLLTDGQHNTRIRSSKINSKSRQQQQVLPTQFQPPDIGSDVPLTTKMDLVHQIVQPALFPTSRHPLLRAFRINDTDADHHHQDDPDRREVLGGTSRIGQNRTTTKIKTRRKIDMGEKSGGAAGAEASSEEQQTKIKKNNYQTFVSSTRSGTADENNNHTRSNKNNMMMTRGCTVNQTIFSAKTNTDSVRKLYLKERIAAQYPDPVNLANVIALRSSLTSTTDTPTPVGVINNKTSTTTSKKLDTANKYDATAAKDANAPTNNSNNKCWGMAGAPYLRHYGVGGVGDRHALAAQVMKTIENAQQHGQNGHQKNHYDQHHRHGDQTKQDARQMQTQQQDVQSILAHPCSRLLAEKGFYGHNNAYSRSKRPSGAAARQPAYQDYYANNSHKAVTIASILSSTGTAGASTDGGGSTSASNPASVSFAPSTLTAISSSATKGKLTETETANKQNTRQLHQSSYCPSSTRHEPPLPPPRHRQRCHNFDHPEMNHQQNFGVGRPLTAAQEVGWWTNQKTPEVLREETMGGGGQSIEEEQKNRRSSAVGGDEGVVVQFPHPPEWAKPSRWGPPPRWGKPKQRCKELKEER